MAAGSLVTRPVGFPARAAAQDRARDMAPVQRWASAVWASWREQHEVILRWAEELAGLPRATGSSPSPPSRRRRARR